MWHGRSCECCSHYVLLLTKTRILFENSRIELSIFFRSGFGSMMVRTRFSDAKALESSLLGVAAKYNESFIKWRTPWSQKVADSRFEDNKNNVRRKGAPEII